LKGIDWFCDLNKLNKCIRIHKYLIAHILIEMSYRNTINPN